MNETSIFLSMYKVYIYLFQSMYEVCSKTIKIKAVFIKKKKWRMNETLIFFKIAIRLVIDNWF